MATFNFYPDGDSNTHFHSIEHADSDFHADTDPDIHADIYLHPDGDGNTYFHINSIRHTATPPSRPATRLD